MGFWLPNRCLLLGLDPTEVRINLIRIGVPHFLESIPDWQMRDPAAATAMGARARARVVDKFSLDAEAAAIAAVYRKLV